MKACEADCDVQSDVRRLWLRIIFLYRSNSLGQVEFCFLVDFRFNR